MMEAFRRSFGYFPRVRGKWFAGMASIAPVAARDLLDLTGL